MLQGPNYIYQCPKCDNLLSKGSLDSGNTFGTKMYSDGNRISPMLSEFPNLTKCSKCNTIFWLSKMKELGSYELGKNINEQWRAAEEAKFLTVYEYFTALETLISITKDDELFIRRRILWHFNDKTRIGEPLFSSKTDENLWLDNIKTLLDLLDINDINEKILLAELNRNLGNFERCVGILDSIEMTNLVWLKKAYKNECDIKNTKVFQLN